MKLLEADEEVRSAQNQLLEDLATQLPSLGRRWVTFRPSSVEMEIMGYGGGRLYVGSRTIRDEQKFWNAFGIFDSARQKQEITVEINFSLEGSRTSGFFASKGERRFLLHTGGIGGGKAGVSKATFLAWLKPQLAIVSDGDGNDRLGIVVAELGAQNLSDRVESFVQSVRAFKDAVGSGKIDDPVFQAEVEQWRDYIKEFSGAKKSEIDAELDYVSYHGNVVEELRSWRALKNDQGLVITNSPMIDLLVHRKGRLVEVYEVKTTTRRQSLYAAIGQLMVHSAGAENVKRCIVYPATDEIQPDIAQAMEELGIERLIFNIGPCDGISIAEP